MSNHYNQTRPEYYRQLRQASESGGDIVPFVIYAVAGFVERLREQLRFIRAQQLAVVWRDYVYETFQNRRAAGDHRRREVALALYPAKPTPFDGIKKLSPRLAEMYATLSDKTVARDLHALVEMGLVGKSKEGYRAKIEILFAFLPARRQDHALTAAEIPTHVIAPEMLRRRKLG